MNKLVLVDTSVFIDYLRGTSEDQLSNLILSNCVVLSPVVKLELLAGVGKKDGKTLSTLLEALHLIPSFDSLNTYEQLLEKAKFHGLIGGLPDIMILQDALRFKLPLFSYDKKLVRLATKLRIPIYTQRS